VQWRPEIELSYAFASEDEPNESRVFVKIGYQHSGNAVGAGQPIEQTRVSVGCAWKF
jgi:hypothetical protein